MSEFSENMVFDLIEKDMNSILTTHLVLGDERFMAATLCTIISIYCEKSHIDVKEFSGRLLDTLYAGEECKE